MVNVVCVKQGNFYGPEYVNRLHNMVTRNTKREFRFICFTDLRDGINAFIECRPLPYSLRGWWCKIPLFAPPKCIEDQQIIAIDLDVVITANIDWLMDYRGDFCILGQWHTARGVQTDKYYNGSVWSLRPGYGAHVWNNFAECADAAMKRCYSDQEYIGEQLPNADTIQELFPGEVMGFNTHYWNLPPDARAYHPKSMWIFHGFPKPKEVCNKVDFVKEHWQ